MAKIEVKRTTAGNEAREETLDLQSLDSNALTGLSFFCERNQAWNQTQFLILAPLCCLGTIFFSTMRMGGKQLHMLLACTQENLQLLPPQLPAAQNPYPRRAKDLPVLFV